MKKGMHSIGEVAKMTGLTVDTLRYYDKIGLLSPNYINEDNHYRYYCETQFWRIEVIRMLRSVNVPIESIMELLATEDEQLVMKKISECLSQTQKKLNYYKKMVDDLKWLKKQCQKMYEPMEEGIYEREVEERIVAYNSLTPTEDMKIHIWAKKDEGLDNNLDTIKKIYGCSLDKEAFFQNRYCRTGEYIYYPQNKAKQIPTEAMHVLPKGRYIYKVAKVVRIPNDTEQRGYVDTADIAEYMREKKYQPKLILAQEIGVPLLNFQELNYEIQILV